MCWSPRMCAVPVNTYLRLGGGGTGRSDHALMLMIGISGVRVGVGPEPGLPE
jgi:hypothetical protein